MSGIPTLVILDEQGALITEGGRGAITDPGFIEAFPWTPPTLEACLASLVDVKGEPLALKSLQESGKHIALYFSAHW